MTHKKFISDHDIQLFKETLNKAHPLKGKNHKQRDASPAHPNLSSVKPQPEPHFKSEFEKPPSIQLHSLSTGNTLPPLFPVDQRHEPSVSPEEKLFFTQSGVLKKQLQKLKKGKMPIAASIDLHGLHASTALKQLEDFFAHCTGGPSHCFCVIHGKGQDRPVLKNLVNQFLKQQKRVLAFCSAPSHLGGTGAALILIKSTL